jgi:hypothetical protein
MNLSPFGFLIALLRLTNIIYQIDKTLPKSVRREFLFIEFLYFVSIESIY